MAESETVVIGHARTDKGRVTTSAKKQTPPLVVRQCHLERDEFSFSNSRPLAADPMREIT